MGNSKSNPIKNKVIPNETHQIITLLDLRDILKTYDICGDILKDDFLRRRPRGANFILKYKKYEYFEIMNLSDWHQHIFDSEVPTFSTYLQIFCLSNEYKLLLDSHSFYLYNKLKNM